MLERALPGLKWLLSTGVNYARATWLPEFPGSGTGDKVPCVPLPVECAVGSGLLVHNQNMVPQFNNITVSVNCYQLLHFPLLKVMYFAMSAHGTWELADERESFHKKTYFENSHQVEKPSFLILL